MFEAERLIVCSAAPVRATMTEGQRGAPPATSAGGARGWAMVGPCACHWGHGSSQTPHASEGTSWQAAGQQRRVQRTRGHAATSPSPRPRTKQTLHGPEEESRVRRFTQRGTPLWRASNQSEAQSDGLQFDSRRYREGPRGQREGLHLNALHPHAAPQPLVDNKDDCSQGAGGRREGMASLA